MGVVAVHSLLAGRTRTLTPALTCCALLTVASGAQAGMHDGSQALRPLHHPATKSPTRSIPLSNSHALSNDVGLMTPSAALDAGLRQDFSLFAACLSQSGVGAIPVMPIPDAADLSNELRVPLAAHTNLGSLTLLSLAGFVGLIRRR